MDEALGGGLPKRALTQIFGKKRVRKSLPALQTAYYVVKGGKDATVLDTEQSYGRLIKWVTAFEKRFDVKIRVVWPRIYRDLKKRRNMEIRGALEALLSKLKIPIDSAKLQALLWILSPDVSLKYEGGNDPDLIHNIDALYS